jgi:hypothetical protein
MKIPLYTVLAANNKKIGIGGKLMSFTTKEYTRRIIVTKTDLDKMVIAQNSFQRYWKREISKATFQANIINLGATVLGFVFKSTTAGIIVTVAEGAFSWASTSYRQTVGDTAENGNNQIVDLFSMMVNNTSYAQIDVELPYLEFRDNATGNLTTIVSGYGIIHRVKLTNGNWITQ